LERKIGVITHFFKQINVAVIDVSETLKIGDKIHVKGDSTDFFHNIESMEIDHKPVENITQGSVGIKLPEMARPNDVVFLVKD
jgi:hypothetical protein